MIQIACQCGAPFAGADEEAVIAAARRHCDEAHADLGLSDQNIRDYVQAAIRMGPPKPRVAQIGEPVIRELTPETLPDYLAFFDRDAFPDNPAWAACYCMFFYHDSTDGEWGTRSAADNRSAIGELVGCGRAHGYLAYVDGKPAAWCNAAPRTLFPGISAAEEYRVEDAEQVGSIVCFVVAPHYRGHGLAQRLLDAALDGFRRRGLTVAEAYPARDPRSDAEAYHGPLSLYEAAGFQPFRELERQVIVRKLLA